MTSTIKILHYRSILTSFSLLPLLVIVLIAPSLSLNTDGSLLLSFKYSVLSDPLSVLSNWNYQDETPCSWTGILCIPLPNSYDLPRVVALYLPNNQILGSVPEDLGLIQHLRHLDLSNNLLNGSLPNSLFFNTSELKILSLSNNVISGELPENFQGLQNLETLNLSDNALAGKIPPSLSSLRNLTVVSLNNNYLSGEIPNGFDSIEVLDLSSNLINGSVPPDFGGEKVKYLNVSYNRLSGEIPDEFAKGIASTATIDLSFNNLSGKIPEIEAVRSQKTEHFSGNPNLCGKPLRNPCLIPSTASIRPNDSSSTSSPTSTTTSPPAIAAMPKTTIGSSPATGAPGSSNGSSNGLRPGAIVGIIVGDLAGIGILCSVFFYVYKSKKKKKQGEMNKNRAGRNAGDPEKHSAPNGETVKGVACFCLKKKGVNDGETSETTSSETEEEDEEEEKKVGGFEEKKKTGALVTVDGEAELELESLLKASAYILGASGSSIVYKAVLEDGTIFAVRRIGESGVERFRDFENQVRAIAKVRHPNILRIRGFYWGEDEKLVIYDHVPNGSLTNVGYRRPGSSPYHLPWEVRLKIARGVARGLTYIHDKKHVHGNLKPSNILLGPNMDPQIGDLGLEKLLWGDNGNKVDGSTRRFGSNRSTASRESFQDLALGANPTPSPSPSSSSVMGGGPAYQAPESLKNLKPSPKWDVYSFGIILLELLTGKTFSDQDLGYWSTGFVAEQTTRVLRMADVAIRADLEGKEDALVTCFKLGFSCASMVPQKRPSMKEVVQVLEKLPSSSSSHH